MKISIFVAIASVVSVFYNVQSYQLIGPSLPLQIPVKAPSTNCYYPRSYPVGNVCGRPSFTPTIYPVSAISPAYYPTPTISPIVYSPTVISPPLCPPQVELPAVNAVSTTLGCLNPVITPYGTISEVPLPDILPLSCPNIFLPPASPISALANPVSSCYPPALPCNTRCEYMKKVPIPPPCV